MTTHVPGKWIGDTAFLSQSVERTQTTAIRWYRKDAAIFPVPPYRSCLRSLKRLGKKCGITKPLSWHVSRHSFATSVCLSNGVPIETVSSMLGHKDIKTTQVYAKITKEKLSKDVEKLSQQLNHIEEFTFGNICSDNTNTKKA